MEEIWRDVPDYEGFYQVSNLGRVRSLPREWKSGKGVLRKHDGKILKFSKTKYGYLGTYFYKDKIRKPVKVHQLVAMAFLGHKPNKYELVVDHINDNPSDNRVENLQIVTPRFNCRKTQGKYSSQYKGVCWNKQTNKWSSQIQIIKKIYHLGYFDNEYDAHIAYQKALQEYNLI